MTLKDRLTLIPCDLPRHAHLGRHSHTQEQARREPEWLRRKREQGLPAKDMTLVS